MTFSYAEVVNLSVFCPAQVVYVNKSRNRWDITVFMNAQYTFTLTNRLNKTYCLLHNDHLFLRSVHSELLLTVSHKCRVD